MNGRGRRTEKRQTEEGTNGRVSERLYTHLKSYVSTSKADIEQMWVTFRKTCTHPRVTVDISISDYPL